MQNIQQHDMDWVPCALLEICFTVPGSMSPLNDTTGLLFALLFAHWNASSTHFRRRLFRHACSRAQAAGGKDRRRQAGRFRSLTAAEKNLCGCRTFDGAARSSISGATAFERTPTVLKGIARPLGAACSESPRTGRTLFRNRQFDRAPAPRRGRPSAIGTGTMTSAPEALVTLREEAAACRRIGLALRGPRCSSRSTLPCCCACQSRTGGAGSARHLSAT